MAMDQARDPQWLRRRQRRRLALAAAAALAAAFAVVVIVRLPAALPSVDGASIWSGQVKRGTMVCKVSGQGSLVPVQMRAIPATAEGRVVAIPVQPGTKVKPSTVLVRLANPQLEKALRDAQAQLQGANADLAQLKATLQAAELDAQTTQTKLQADYQQAKMHSDSDQGLLAAGLIPRLDAQTDAVKLAALDTQMKLGQQRLKSVRAADAARILSLQAKVREIHDAVTLAQTQVDALTIRAGIAGVLEGLNARTGGSQLQVGQWVDVGTEVARVVQPDQLKAEVKVAESDAGSVALNQPAGIDTHLGIVPGHVARIAPNAVNGLVTVDLALDAPLPPGARPDLSVDATINIDTLNNVLYVGRPAFGQANQTITMFRLSPDGRQGRRVKVALGLTSVKSVQILRGLNAGDWVILSDTTAEDKDDAVRFSPPVSLP